MNTAQNTTPDLPPIIQRAIARASNPEFCPALAPANRVAFLTLLRRVSVRVGDCFWVKRANFAKLLNISEATVYRTLSTLEQSKLIERKAQKRDSEGGYTVGEIVLTNYCTELLGLKGEQAESIYKRQAKNLAVSHGCETYIDNQVKEQSLQKQPGGFSSKTSESEKTSGTQTSRPGSIPEDLAKLQALGLNPPAVFALMRITSRRKQRLADVVAVVGAAIDKLKPREVFAYLKAVIAKNNDFAWIRQKQLSDENRKTGNKLAAEKKLAKVKQLKELEALKQAQKALEDQTFITNQLIAFETLDERLRVELIGKFRNSLKGRQIQSMFERSGFGSVMFRMQFATFISQKWTSTLY
jgi:DNA-binding transcriptional ArsR family regulator